MLGASLDEAIGRLWIPQLKFGSPELLVQMLDGTKKLANGLSALEGQRNSAIKLASRFLKGETLDAIEMDQLAFVVCEVIPELDGLSIIGSDRLPFLIKHFSDEAKAGELWGPIWRALLISYFNFNPDVADTKDEKEGWESLGKLIRNTWPDIDKKASTKFIPSWLSAIRQEPAILGERPAMKFAADFLAGKTEVISRLTEELAIPSSSWFWHALVHEATTHAIFQHDDQFKAFIPTLLELIDEKRFYRDVSLAAILERYFKCKENECNEELKDYSIQSWKNPNALEDGVAPGWNHVSKSVWQMVCSWVNENNLRDFFDILARRNMADEGRLDFWRQYIKQITQTRFVFCDHTIALRRRDVQVEKLITREEGRYARYRTNKAEDAFMMQIGTYLVIEFSRAPNACYIYNLKKLPFDKKQKLFDGTQDDLKYGFRGENAARFTHQEGWELSASLDLKRLGIYPDSKKPSSIKNEASNKIQPTIKRPWRSCTDREKYKGGSSTPTLESAGSSRPSDSSFTKVTAPKVTVKTYSPQAEVFDFIQELNFDSLWVEDHPIQSDLFDRSREPEGAPFTMKQLHDFVTRDPALKLIDERTAHGGRIWVLGQTSQEKFVVKLNDWGFQRGRKREGWYYVVE